MGISADEQRRLLKKWIVKIGLGFHPDTRGKDYVGRDRVPVFTKRERAEYDRDISRAFSGPKDVYEVGIGIMRAYGRKSGDPEFRRSGSFGRKNPGGYRCRKCGKSLRGYTQHAIAYLPGGGKGPYGPPIKPKYCEACWPQHGGATRPKKRKNPGLTRALVADTLATAIQHVDEGYGRETALSIADRYLNGMALSPSEERVAKKAASVASKWSRKNPGRSKVPVHLYQQQDFANAMGPSEGEIVWGMAGRIGVEKVHGVHRNSREWLVTLEDGSLATVKVFQKKKSLSGLYWRITGYVPKKAVKRAIDEVVPQTRSNPKPVWKKKGNKFDEYWSITLPESNLYIDIERTGVGGYRWMIWPNDSVSDYLETWTAPSLSMAKQNALRAARLIRLSRKGSASRVASRSNPKARSPKVGEYFYNGSFFQRIDSVIGRDRSSRPRWEVESSFPRLGSRYTIYLFSGRSGDTKPRGSFWRKVGS